MSSRSRGTTTLLHRSGQRRRFLAVAFWGNLIGIALCFLSVSQVEQWGRRPVLMLTPFLVALLYASVNGYLFVSIKCPKCRTRLAWKAVRERPAHQSYLWILTLTNCPVCGDDGSTAPDTEHEGGASPGA